MHSVITPPEEPQVALCQTIQVSSQYRALAQCLGLLVQVGVRDPCSDVTKQTTGTEIWSSSMKHLKNYHSSHININPFQAPDTYIHL